MPNAGKRLTDSNTGKRKPLTKGHGTKPSLAAEKPEKVKLSFSFDFFKQIDCFGLGAATTNWFASLIDRLKDLSGKETGIIGDFTQRKQYKFHPIDWEQPNIPIQRADLNWIPKNYLENEKDYPILQFKLSRSTGRVAGFFDETSSVFYIVLIDPKHNLQPTLDHGYKVDKASPLPTTYEMALRYASKCPNASSCPLRDGQQTADDMFRAVFIDTDDSQVIDALREKGISFQDAFMQFILKQI